MRAPEEALRHCTKCGTDQPLSQFCRDARGPGGYKWQCKTCDSAYMSEWRARNPHKIRDYSREAWAKRTEAEKDKIRQYQRDRYAFDKTPNRRSYLKRVYNISLEHFEAMYEAQGHRCAICGGVNSDRTLAVDHDHSCCPGKRSCGKCIRGLLCSNCNNGLGRFQDDPALLTAALRYVTQKEPQ